MPVETTIVAFTGVRTVRVACVPFAVTCTRPTSGTACVLVGTANAAAPRTADQHVNFARAKPPQIERTADALLDCPGSPSVPRRGDYDRRRYGSRYGGLPTRPAPRGV